MLHVGGAVFSPAALIAEAQSLLPKDLPRVFSLCDQLDTFLIENPTWADHEHLTADAERIRGTGLRLAGQYGDALTLLRRARGRYERLNDLNGCYQCDLWMGAVFRQMADLAASFAHYNSALDLAKRIQSLPDEIRALNGIASLHSKQGDHADAVQVLKRAQAMSETVRNDDMLATVLGNLCAEYSSLEQFDVALEAGLQAIALREQMGHSTEALIPLARVAGVYIALKHWDTAESYLQRAQTLAEQGGYVEALLDVRLNRAHLYIGAGRDDDALEELLAILAHGKSIGLETTYICYRDLAQVYERRSDFVQAYAALKQYHDASEQIRVRDLAEQLRQLEMRFRIEQAARDAEFYRQRAEAVETQRVSEHAYFTRLARLKDEFFSSASHDLKSPLTRVKLNADLLERLVKTDDVRISNCLSRIRVAADSMAELVGDLLVFARLESSHGYHPLPVQLIALVSESIQASESFAAQRQIRLLMMPSQVVDEVWVMGDATLLRRVMDNLLSNAIKYTRESTDVEISVAVGDENVEVTVRDFGPGIPPEELPMIFERFYRGQQHQQSGIEGTGLGLAIVNSIVKLHSGQIILTSEVGQGAAFAFSLPRVLAPE